MDSYSLFVQATGFIPSFISIASIQLNSHRRILILQLITLFMWVIHYYLLSAYKAVLTNPIGIFRFAVSCFNDRSWARSILRLYLIIALPILSSVLTRNGPVSLLPAVSLICTAAGFRVRDLRITRILTAVQSPCLLVCDIACGSRGCAVIETVALHLLHPRNSQTGHCSGRQEENRESRASPIRYLCD